MCAGIDSVIQYYEIFNRKKRNGEHNLKITTIFSYGQNEEEMKEQVAVQLGMVAEPRQNTMIPAPHHRNYLKIMLRTSTKCLE